MLAELPESIKTEKVWKAIDAIPETFEAPGGVANGNYRSGVNLTVGAGDPELITVEIISDVTQTPEKTISALAKLKGKEKEERDYYISAILGLMADVAEKALTPAKREIARTELAQRFDQVRGPRTRINIPPSLTERIARVTAQPG